MNRKSIISEKYADTYTCSDSKRRKMVVASSPLLDIATQGKTEDEVKENMADLIADYFKDPDTPKPKMDAIMKISITNMPVNIPEGVLHNKLRPLPQRKNNTNSPEQWLPANTFQQAHNFQENRCQRQSLDNLGAAPQRSQCFRYPVHHKAGWKTTGRV